MCNRPITPRWLCREINSPSASLEGAKAQLWLCFFYPGHRQWTAQQTWLPPWGKQLTISKRENGPKTWFCRRGSTSAPCCCLSPCWTDCPPRDFRSRLRSSSRRSRSAAADSVGAEQNCGRVHMCVCWGQEYESFQCIKLIIDFYKKSNKIPYVCTRNKTTNLH